MCQIHEKLVEGELWAEVTGVTIWGHIKILLGMCKLYETIFVWVSYFILLSFFAFEVMRGHDFWTHLQTCMELVDLLPPILES